MQVSDVNLRSPMGGSIYSLIFTRLLFQHKDFPLVLPVPFNVDHDGTASVRMLSQDCVALNPLPPTSLSSAEAFRKSCLLLRHPGFTLIFRSGCY